MSTENNNTEKRDTIHKRTWRAKHPEKARLAYKKCYEQWKIRVSAEERRKIQRAIQKRWRENNPDKVRENNAKNYQKRKMRRMVLA